MAQFSIEIELMCQMSCNTIQILNLKSKGTQHKNEHLGQRKSFNWDEPYISIIIHIKITVS